MNDGKYTEVCAWVRETTKADGVVLIVLNGNQGNGISVQAPEPFTDALPELLEKVAMSIRVSPQAWEGKP